MLLREFMMEFLDDVFGLAIFFGPPITAFILATFSPLRQIRQRAKLFVIGFFSSAVAAIFSISPILRGAMGSRGFRLSIGISFVVGALISPLTSSETIREKEKGEVVRKSDDRHWRA
jgi:hypothetical protein